MKNMKMNQKGFTLIELMIVVAIIGILAAVAIPAYQDYTVRARMSEALTGLSGIKVSIGEYYVAQGSMPLTEGAAGMNTDGTAYATTAINEINYAYTSQHVGVITVEINDIGGDTAADQSFDMTGSGAADNAGQVTWTCATDDIDPKYLPSECR